VGLAMLGRYAKNQTITGIQKTSRMKIIFIFLSSFIILFISSCKDKLVIEHSIEVEVVPIPLSPEDIKKNEEARKSFETELEKLIKESIGKDLPLQQDNKKKDQ
jgi:predicted nucleotidyltransferase